MLSRLREQHSLPLHLVTCVWYVNRISSEVGRTSSVSDPVAPLPEHLDGSIARPVYPRAMHSGWGRAAVVDSDCRCYVAQHSGAQAVQLLHPGFPLPNALRFLRRYPDRLSLACTWNRQCVDSAPHSFCLRCHYCATAAEDLDALPSSVEA